MSLHLWKPEYQNICAVLSVLLAGIIFGFAVYYFDSIWFAMVAHCAWNFTEDLFEYQDSIFVIAAEICVSAIVCLAIWLIGRKRKERDLDVWAEAERESGSENESAAELSAIACG